MVNKATLFYIGQLSSVQTEDGLRFICTSGNLQISSSKHEGPLQAFTTSPSLVNRVIFAKQWNYLDTQKKLILYSLCIRVKILFFNGCTHENHWKYTTYSVLAVVFLLVQVAHTSYFNEQSEKNNSVLVPSKNV